jgi:DNA-binding transcriptional ArsR family regulator
MATKAPADQRVISAVGHPIRRQILTILADEPASAKEIAQRLGMTIPRVSYHLARLRELGLLELVSETPRRGAIERHYRADRRAATAAWDAIAAVMAAAGSGDGNAMVEAHTFTFDKKAETELAKAMKDFWKSVNAIGAASDKRLASGRARGNPLTVGVVRGAPLRP